MGAGPAGLGAAVLLARRGRRVVVRERHGHVGERFHGDFQGIENWSSHVDALDEMAAMGLPVTRLPLTAFRSVDLWAGPRGPFRIEASRPLFYLVRRGADPDTLDAALLQAALDAGAEIRFDEAVSTLHRGGLVATGPHAADVIAEGIAFEWEGPDLAVAVVDPDLAPGGYAYLLRHGGRATLVTVLWRDFRSIHQRLARVQDWFADRYSVRPTASERFGGFGAFDPDLPAARSGRLYLGESAGLQDFLWGFGIRYALRSARLAVDALLDGADPAAAYARSVDRTLTPRMRASLLDRAIFERLERHAVLPRLLPHLARRDPHRLLHFLFNEGPIRRPIGRWLARRYRSQLVDRRCHEAGCPCVWCRCAAGSPAHQSASA